MVRDRVRGGGGRGARAPALPTVPGTGSDLYWRVEDPGGRPSKVSDANSSYAPPLIVRFEGEGAAGASTRGGEEVTIIGDNFGVDSTTVDAVRYGDLGVPEFDVTPNCSVIEPHTRIRCATIEGAGGDAIKWVVTVNGQQSIAPVTSAATPVVRSIELFDRSTGDALGDDDFAKVCGGDGLRVRGDHFTATTPRRLVRTARRRGDGGAGVQGRRAAHDHRVHHRGGGDAICPCASRSAVSLALCRA